jgi:hypothetical protein
MLKVIIGLFFYYFFYSGIGLMGCSPVSPSSARATTPSALLTSVEDLKKQLEGGSPLRPEMVHFIKACTFSQRKEILKFCKNTSFASVTCELLASIATQDFEFQKQLIQLLTDAEWKTLAEGVLLHKGVELHLHFWFSLLTDEECAAFLSCIQNLENEALVKLLSVFLRRDSEKERAWAWRALQGALNLQKLPFLKKIFQEEKEQGGFLAQEVALQLAYLEEAEGALFLLNALPGSSPEWKREVGKAFLFLGKKGRPALQNILKSGDTPKIQEVLQLQLILKDRALAKDLLPLLVEEPFQEGVLLFLRMVTQKEGGLDVEK